MSTPSQFGVAVFGGLVLVWIGVCWYWDTHPASSKITPLAEVPLAPTAPYEIVKEYATSNGNFVRYHDTAKHVTCWVMWGSNMYQAASIGCIPDRSLGDAGCAP